MRHWGSEGVKVLCAIWATKTERSVISGPSPLRHWWVGPVGGSRIHESPLYTRTAGANLAIHGNDCELQTDVSLNPKQMNSTLPLVWIPKMPAVTLVPPNLRGSMAEGNLEWKEINLNQLWLKCLTSENFTDTCDHVQYGSGPWRRVGVPGAEAPFMS